MREAIEAMLDQPMDCVESADLGKASRISDAAGRYIEFCKSTFPAHLGLDGYKIVVDYCKWSDLSYCAKCITS